MSKLIFQQINKQVKSANKILIISHQKPDGDACGSALALSHFLKSLNKEVAIFIADPPPVYFGFLPNLENISNNYDLLKQKWDLVIVVDAGDWAYTQVDPQSFKGTPIINIDHHFSNQGFGDINLVDDLASSTCEIIYKFFSEIGWAINRSTATVLLCGILNDTGVFSNAATTIEAMKISSLLISQGAKIYKINNQVVQNKTINGLRLWGEVLSRLKSDDELKIAYTYIKEEEYIKYKINEEELDGLINFLNVISDANITALFRINKNKTTVSLRTTKDDIDVSKIASAYGGGGHKKAAGFTLPYVLDERNCDFVSYLKNIIT